MSQLLRLFQTAVDPADVDEVRRLFTDDLLPAYRGFDGCVSIELALDADHHPGGLVELAAISRWSSSGAMAEAMESRAAREAQVRIFELLRQEPLVRVFEVIT
ncbi:MAG TPA: hypothetical protein VFJ85_11350 [Acidimicrobiales bacterium]|nr:hypothetical protein [Acidimicrobiales bacterium]